ncbi:MAG: aminodeoxychorismate synthase component I [Sulfuriferula sp.]|nr:aminodeoxychorismate synthase component I [Sulfuriferula sp.]
MPIIRLSAIPDLFNLHASDPQRYPVLLETAAGEGWHILMAHPLQLERYAADQSAAFFERFEQTWQQSHAKCTVETQHLPFRGGWFVYLGYELLHEIEPSVPKRAAANSDFPVAVLMRVPAAVLVNKRDNEAWLFAESAPLLQQMQDDVLSFTAPTLPEPMLADLVEETADVFLDGIAKIQRYIAAGDVFQVNLSRRWRGRMANRHSAAALYHALRRNNPAPFAGIANLGNELFIVSSSPERLVQVESGRALTRPIAGTHPRHMDAVQDAQIRRDLIAHPKERAEHVMLVDLERNDLGRVCVPGSVKVDELMAVASYQHVHHIESTVSGQLHASVSPVDVIKALFPGGTITGCPKVRTMQIIRELESSPRGAYTGSMGYINLDGDFDLNILIRTMMLSGQALEFSAGAGIVADSDPERELQETRAKAKGLLRALGLT